MGDDKISLEEIVARFLRRNPGFLNDYPDVLESLQLNHRAGTATSLIERQVAHLRRKNEELNRQLNRLVHVASENEQLMSRLHQLTLELMAIGSSDPARFYPGMGTLFLDLLADVIASSLDNVKPEAQRRSA